MQRVHCRLKILTLDDKSEMLVRLGLSILYGIHNLQPVFDRKRTVR